MFLLITPPFTQLNTPYPATAYIKGFLNTLGVDSYQVDLGLEVILALFSKEGLQNIFDEIEENEIELSENAYRIFSQKKKYIKTIEPVILFLQNKNQTMVHTICTNGYLPKASRFDNLEDLDWAFGSMGTHDKARHLSTLYLEDIGDLITEVIDEHFGFSRYAERLGRTASSFDDLYYALFLADSIVSTTLLQVLDKHIKNHKPTVVCITAPFPGNVFGAFKCGQFIKKNYPSVKVIFGGGYANTELRSIYDERVFLFVDYITLDDGEAPLQHLIEYFGGKRTISELKRTFCLTDNVVSYNNGSKDFDIPQKEVGTPDYRNLLLNDYLSVIEVINPMHRLWSDGRWNKLTLAHGCYWGKCSFCDVTLDYIKRYEPVSASLLCDRIATIIEQTGQNGFHFVDEAAPPALMRDLAVEILKREMTVVWWTNIRFEKSFTTDLCRLLRSSGCIAVSGGLEVASDRLLAKMQKGVTVAQVAQVANAFTKSDIMVHAYLMYGFPTQTAQETMDSLEMVRQLFENEVIQSGFWHQFAMTAHSPVGLDPQAFGVKSIGPIFAGFAENDMYHEDPKGTDHEAYSEGLKHAIFNFMQGVGFEEKIHNWFDFRVPKTSVQKHYIKNCLEDVPDNQYRDNDLLIWIGGEIIEVIIDEDIHTNENTEICFSGLESNYSIYFEEKKAIWISELIERISIEKMYFKDMKQSYSDNNFKDFDHFLFSASFLKIKEQGLLFV
jgi:radical SAM superfamily enzyme YgiQ (UPF0313 family)